MTLPGVCKYDFNGNPAGNCSSVENKIKSYVCDLCEKRFSVKNSLIAHINTHNISDNDIDVKNETPNRCSICLKKFTAKKNLLKHLRDVHKNYTEAERMVVKKLRCPEKDCKFLCRMTRELRNHIEKCHKIKILKDTLQFPSEAVFQKWKREEESNTASWFVTGRKKTTLTDGTKKQTLYCHRTGHYSPKGFGKHRMRSVGSCKIGVTCPAAMEVTESAEGELTVIYYKTHLGHLQDVVYLKLSKEERGHLEEKIKQGFTFDAILEDIKESRDVNKEKKKRIHLLSKKDLYRIMYRSKNSSSRKSRSKEFVQNNSSHKVLQTEEKNLPVDNMPVEKSKENASQNFSFYPHSSVISLQDQPKVTQNNLNVLAAQKGQRDLNAAETATEGVAPQIVILSQDIDYSSIAEIILLSAGDGASTQPELFAQTKMEASESQTGDNPEHRMPVSDGILSEHKIKGNKSNLYLQLKEKLHKISEYLPQSEHLTPRQFDLINAKLDGILGIFNVANEKAKTRKHILKKTEVRQNKALPNIRSAVGGSKNNIYKTQEQQHYGNSLIYAVYN